jgi:hypothetical protein
MCNKDNSRLEGQVLWRKIKDYEASKPLLLTSAWGPHWSIQVYLLLVYTKSQKDY